MCALFVPWLRELGTRENFAKWVSVPDFREEVKDAIRSGKWFIRAAYNPNTNPRWAENIWVLEHKDEKLENRSIADIAEERDVDPFDTWFDIIVEDPDSKGGTLRTENPDASYHAIFFQHPVSSVSLDTAVFDYKYKSEVPPWSVPMARAYSGFVGFFEKFVNKQGALTLVEAVQKTSTQAALRHNLKGLGLLKEGYYADIVLMDLPKMRVTATPLEPRNQPEGIEYVIINGVKVVEETKHTGATPGRVIKRE
jgi:N-acyl-D-aspartate/D-glutamate deacylase